MSISAWHDVTGMRPNRFPQKTYNIIIVIFRASHTKLIFKRLYSVIADGREKINRGRTTCRSFDIYSVSEKSENSVLLLKTRLD